MENAIEVLSVTDTGEITKTGLTTTPINFSKEAIELVKKTVVDLDSPQYERGLSFSPDYYQFETIGTVVRGVFLGFKTITKKDDLGVEKPIVCAVFAIKQADEIKMFMCGSKTFVQPFADGSIPQGKPFEAVYSRKEKATNGHVKIFEIYPLING